uniref:Uncharacterized protein n=1 Tax=Rhizophora mucronata TaxID=61149 RepID=A0A2P2NP36_RHIMU
MGVIQIPLLTSKSSIKDVQVPAIFEIIWNWYCVKSLIEMNFSLENSLTKCGKQWFQKFISLLSVGFSKWKYRFCSLLSNRYG